MTRSGEVAMILATTVLTGLVLSGLLLFVAPPVLRPVLEPVLIAITRLPSPFDDIAWLAVFFPLVVVGPPLLWLGIYRIVAWVCGIAT